MEQPLGELEKQIYDAFQKNSIDEKIIKKCEQVGGLHICTINKGTILHLAIYHEKYKLALKLLEGLISSCSRNTNLVSEKLCVVDNWGHTLLHCASVSNDGVNIARKLLNLAPKLLEIHDNNGENALFCTCRYNQLEMFEFLANHVDSYYIQNSDSQYNKDNFFQRLDDGFNILHLSIRMQTFELALKIVHRYQHLCKEKGPGGMTALQMLACCPTAFPRGSTPKLNFIKRFIYNIVEFVNKKRVEKNAENDTLDPKAFSNCVSRMIRLHNTHMTALKLLEFLVKIDDNWKQTSITRDNDQHNNKLDLQTCEYQSLNIEEEPQNALLLAAEHGCYEVVEEILKEHPLAIEQVNARRQNLLHLVIKHRHLEIHEYLKKYHEVSVGWMSRVVDVDGNTVLHMVGFFDKSQDVVDAKLRSPVTQLSRDLGLLEELKEKCPTGLSYHKNKKMQTADEMFAENSKKLQGDSKEWLERTTTQGIVVAGLIVSVIFAAVYQVPGGSDKDRKSDQGKAKFFSVFMFSDVVSLASALTAIVLFLFIHTSSKELDQFQTWLPTKLNLSFVCLLTSVAMMMITFAATVIEVVIPDKKRTNIIIYLVVFIPVFVLLFLYVPLYFQLAKSFFLWIRNNMTTKAATRRQAEEQDEEAV